VAPDGVTLTRRLADRLGVVSGDILTIEVMKGRRYKRDLPVNAIADELIGMASYMNTDTLNRLTGEGEVASAAAMYVDPGELSALSRRLKELPVIESVAMKAHTIDSFLWERLPASSWLLRGS
jgi:putative ABC transport system permease protein